MRVIFILFGYLILISSTCSRKGGSEVNPGFKKESFELEYTFNAPDTIYKMKRALTEISGLSYSTFSRQLVAINDEKADVYYLSPTTGAIINTTDFGKSDDYEGIAAHGSTIYIVESNGNIKVLDETTSEKIGEYDDELSRDNDVEGLVYNRASNSLLLAAKGDSEVDGNDKDVKAIFEMNIENGKIDKDPFMTIDVLEAVKELPSENITSNAIVNLSVTSRLKNFAPSGIAVHPKSNDIYMVSSKGKLLVVTSQQGDVKSIVFLDQGFHVQPEGICFDTEANLYISNEGRGTSAKIYKYLPKKLEEKKKY